MQSGTQGLTSTEGGWGSASQLPLISGICKLKLQVMSVQLRARGPAVEP